MRSNGLTVLLSFVCMVTLLVLSAINDNAFAQLAVLKGKTSSGSSGSSGSTTITTSGSSGTSGSSTSGTSTSGSSTSSGSGSTAVVVPATKHYDGTTVPQW